MTYAVFAENSAYCLESDIAYSTTITGGADTSFITNTAGSRDFTWETVDPSFAGVYTITMTGTIINAAGTFA